MIRAVLTDIEGTTTPIAFVRDTLFPYAARALPGFLARNATRPDVAALLDQVRALAPGQDPPDALAAWMRQDAKVTPLKALQGLVWHQGYLDGALHGALYPDVSPTLHAWHARGLRIACYSSGSVAAQRLLFGHTASGDLARLFEAWFDTTTGPKQDPASYRRIAAALALPGAQILFLSDMAAELDAARAAGLATCQLLRAEDGTIPSPDHPHAPDFAAIPV